MGERTQDKDVRVVVREVLRHDWDPIGVYGFEGAENEYDSYVAPVVQLLEKCASVDEIFDFLSWVEVKHMGLTGDPVRTRQIATRLHLLCRALHGAP